MAWWLDNCIPNTPEATTFVENFLYVIPEYHLAYYEATIRRFPFPYATSNSRTPTPSETEQQDETTDTIETESANEFEIESARPSKPPLLQQHLMILSEQELRDNPDLLELIDSAHSSWRHGSKELFPTRESPWGPDAVELPPRFKARISALQPRPNESDIPWHYYVAIPVEGGFACSYVGTSLTQFRIHAGEVRTHAQVTLAGDDFPWPSLIRIICSDEFRKSKGKEQLWLKVAKEEGYCTLHVLSRRFSNWGQPETAPVVDEDLESEAAGEEQGLLLAQEEHEESYCGCLPRCLRYLSQLFLGLSSL